MCGVMYLYVTGVMDCVTEASTLYMIEGMVVYLFRIELGCDTVL